MSSSKKMKQEPKLGGEGKRARIQTIDDVLPPEMLMAILKYIPTSTLVSSCRKVNRKWNENSSSLLRHRPETLLKFFLGSNGSVLFNETPNDVEGYEEKAGYEKMVKKQEAKNFRTLEEFMDCYKTSKNFPFTRFSFNKIYDGGDDLTNFLTQFGSKILSIKISPPANEKDVQLLRQLLTEYCPDLQELIFDKFVLLSEMFEDNTAKYSGIFKLFADEDKITSFPNLKSLYLTREYKLYLGVVEDILRAASGLKEIRGYWEEISISGWISGIGSEDIEFLNKCGKLHLVKCATLKDDDLAAYWKKSPGQKMRLSKMKVVASDININTFIEHSKDSLKELAILREISYGRDIFRDVNWSLIPNLQKLYLHADPTIIIFPVGESPILPNLKELEILGCANAVEDSNLRCVPFPSVKILKWKFYPNSCEFVENLCVMFPHVTCLDLSHMENFSDVGHVIWKNMKQLMTLCVLIPLSDPAFDEEWPANAYKFSTELDSCFTGYSEETCIELREIFKGKTEISEDELLKYDRENPSIVDLKYLTTLKLKHKISQCYCHPWTTFKNEKKELVRKFKERISHVSRLFAFQQMSNLQIKIETEVTFGC